MKIPYLEEIKEKISNKRKTAYYARRHGLSVEEYRNILIAHYDECVNFFENINVISINFIILYSKLSYGKKRKIFSVAKKFYDAEYALDCELGENVSYDYSYYHAVPLLKKICTALGPATAKKRKYNTVPPRNSGRYSFILPMACLFAS